MAAFGSYDVLEIVAVSSTGIIYRARHREIGRLAAIKELSEQLRAVPGLLDRFRSEAPTLASLDDDHVVAVFDFVEEPDRVWIAEEWVDGVTIAGLLVAGRQLSAEQSLGVLRGALLGLAHAHDRNLVHRDFSPANIVTDEAGTAKLLDFGLAAPVGGTGVCGTPAYMSPEAVRGEAVSKSSDVYSAAAVLYTMLSGRPPFSAVSVEAVLRAQVAKPPPLLAGHGSALAKLVSAGLAKDPAARPADARAFVYRLEDAAQQRYGVTWLERASIAGMASAATAGGAVPLT
jgi:eukaryotic-like serine/threonine-protein kinase